MLYTRIAHALPRPENVWEAPLRYAGLLDLEGVDPLPEQPFPVRLGGDGREATAWVSKVGAHLRVLETVREIVLGQVATLRGLTLYLATPSVFAEGWRPRLPEKSGLRLVGAAVGRPVPVAGWDAERRAPKPPLRAAPAGSVYFYTLPEGMGAEGAQKLVEDHFLSNAVCEMGAQEVPAAEEPIPPPPYPAIGYGLALFGLWDARPLLKSDVGQRQTYHQPAAKFAYAQDRRGCLEFLNPFSSFLTGGRARKE
jgi:hypothetical protein